MTTAEAIPAGVDQLRGLAARWATRAGFAEVLDWLRPGRDASLDGVWGSARALVAAAVAERSSGPVVIVLPRPEEVDLLCDDLPLFTGRDVRVFPPWETEPGEEVVADAAYGQRLQLLKLLTEKENPRGGSNSNGGLIVTSIHALMQPVPAPAMLAASTRVLRVGDSFVLDELLPWLVQCGYHATSAVELPGEFATRGGIVDVFAPEWDDPVRIELFGDQIESIRRFDIADQRSLAALEEVSLTGLPLESATSSRDHLAAYLPKSSRILLVEPQDIEEQGKHFHRRIERPEMLHSVPTVMQTLYRLAVLTAESLATSPVGTPGGPGSGACKLPIESVERFSGDIRRVRDELDSAGHGQEVFVVCQTEAESKRLAELFNTPPTQTASEGRLHFVVGRLHAGFRLVDERMVLVSGDELFQRTDLHRATRRKLSRVIDSFVDLREGDLVVHLAHGIARYRGMKLLDRSHGTEEHLELEFDEGTKVYVPASKMNLVQKYIGGTKRRPSLAKIGGKTWARQKQAAESAVNDLAIEMLQLQAARESRPGIRFQLDSLWQQEFDASFPYRETPDQLTSIEAIKQDMERARPMDRLLCGDVGFGKTELAIRAAFKAVDNGYQVAVLAPTTILVEQHFRTFTRRMAEFPFEIARLSRFCTTKEERDIVKGLAAGAIDIVIGTHRLASRDVDFHNLGLVIIDEEQRFGVEVKERLKTLRQTVDVLTMTATPIPRTLHMSLLGVRDISNLETPPDDRIAVETRVTRWDANLIRHAVLRELNRGGQVYFVHNRVADIQNLAIRLREIVPEARVIVGHGQMPEDQLEQVMLAFVDRQYDLLLATTIIESGLDIPNANTIFIDEAQRYGLADLHQLRGRVGRYKHRAYCYLLVDSHGHLTPDAARRLRAIEEYSKLGAGFAIAMRDLEIRGAGNILGTQQSGHIAAVGYEMYCQLLEQAVRNARSLPPLEKAEVDIDLPVEAFIPPPYIPDQRLKIDLYRRLARVATDEQLQSFAAELVDRFGKPPPEVERLLALADLRVAAARWRIDTVRFEKPYVVFQYQDHARITQLSRLSGRTLRIVDNRSAYLPIAPAEIHSDGLLAACKSLLRPA